MKYLADFKSDMKKPAFYVTLISCLLALAGLVLYLAVGKTQYNAQKLTTVIIVMLVAAMVCFLAATLTGIRFFRYIAAVAMLYAFLEYVITEINFWSNWIVATDPVEGAMLRQYFIITIILLVALIGAFIAAAMGKKAYYGKREEAKA